jgi:hypothetical protein
VTELAATKAAVTELTVTGQGRASGGRGVLAPWVATGCRIAMGVTMAFMLLIMI